MDDPDPRNLRRDLRNHRARVAGNYRGGLVFLFGIYSIADGLITIVRAIRDREHLSSWGWWVFTGVVSVGAGIVALVWPGITALVLLYIIAFYAIMFGIFGIVGASR